MWGFFLIKVMINSMLWYSAGIVYFLHKKVGESFGIWQLEGMVSFSLWDSFLAASYLVTTHHYHLKKDPQQPAQLEQCRNSEENHLLSMLCPFLSVSSKMFISSHFLHRQLISNFGWNQQLPILQKHESAAKCEILPYTQSFTTSSN